MAVKDANAKVWTLLPSSDGRRYSAWPAGDKPSGALRTITGLTFPSNGAAGSDIALDWTGANMVPRFAHTAIWRVSYKHQLGYYALIWHCRDDNTWGGPNDTAKYFMGTHPYPCDGRTQGDGGALAGTGGTGSAQYHEIADGNDKIATPGGQSKLVVKTGWLTQARTVQQVGSDYVHTFWPDLESYPEFSIVHTRPVSDYTSPGMPTMKFRVGASPWTASGDTNTEAPSCDFQGLLLYDRSMTLAEVLARAVKFDTLTEDTTDPDVWYSNVKMTPTDVTDKSGQGHNPAWANANRPTLFTESSYSASFVRMALQDPLSDGGVWTNNTQGTGGNAAPNSQSSVRVINAASGGITIAAGDANGQSSPYDYLDSFAFVPGLSGNQRITAVVYVDPGYTPNVDDTHEIELILGCVASAGTGSGGTRRWFECLWSRSGSRQMVSLGGGFAGSYPGAANDFQGLTFSDSGQYAAPLTDGMVWRAELNRAASTVTTFIWNGTGWTQVLQYTGPTYMSGLGNGVGIATFRRTANGTTAANRYGFRSIKIESF